MQENQTSMKNKIFTLLMGISIFLIIIGLFTACSKQEIVYTDEERTYLDYVNTGKIIAVEAGDVYGDVARDIFKAKEIPEFLNVADKLEALRLGSVDAVLLGHSYIRQLLDSGMYPDLEYLWVPKEVYVNESANVFHTIELQQQFNAWLEVIKADGTYDKVVNRWIGAPLPNEEDIPRFEFTGENGILRVAETGYFPPLTYLDSNNHLVGFGPEMVSLFALHLGMRPQWTLMSYENILPFVVTGRADMSGCDLAITDYREENVIFGEPTVITQAVLIVPGVVHKSLSYNDFRGKRLGTIAGTVTERTIQLIGGVPVLYKDESGGMEDVRLGRTEGYMTSLDRAQTMAEVLGVDTFDIIPIPKEIFSAPLASISHDQALIDRFNIFLAEINDGGMLAEIQARWFGGDRDLDSPIPEITNTGSNGKLVVAICSGSLPYVFSIKDGEYSGYSVELALRFGAYESKTIEFVDMDFGGLIPYIVSKKADMAFADITITEERKRSVIFTDPIFEETHAILILKQNTPTFAYSDMIDEKNQGFIQSTIIWLKMGVERNLITDNRWKLVIDGFKVTLIISLFAQLFGTIFGGFICYLLLRKNRLLKWLGKLYCGLINGTPMVVLLMISYYIIFGGTKISNVLVAILAFTMMVGSGVAQTLKGAIDTVDVTEIEAARSLGFSAIGAFLKITLLQAIKRALPAYTKGFVELVKATAIVGYIAIQDLTRAGDIIRSRTYDAYFPILFVAMIYLTVTTICIIIFNHVIKRITR